MDMNADGDDDRPDYARSGRKRGLLAQRPRSGAREATAPERSTIREMARAFGVSIRALRFYEDRGLLHPRRDGTARSYGQREKLHLKMILKGKQLGFTLSEIHDMLASREAANFNERDFDEWDLDEANLEMGLPQEQIVAQIGYLERQRKELDAAIVALQAAHRRLLESPYRPRD
jgi:DNA-binding transcriptional MerR regulator